MKQTCCITGNEFEEGEGTYTSQLRPALKEFLKTYVHGYSENAFISFKALNEAIRNFINKLTAEEEALYNKLRHHQRQRFEKDKILEPIHPPNPDEPLTRGERLADKIADFGGSWKFILLFFGVLVFWMILNVILLRNSAFDPYPFILLNLALSCVAALQAPVIMMSQNRMESKDRQRSEYDFKVDMKAEKEIRLLHEKVDHILAHQHRTISEILQLHLDTMQQLQLKKNDTKA